MSVKTIEKDFIDKVSAEIQLSADGKNRFLVFTPFHFNDGDQLVIVLKRWGIDGCSQTRHIPICTFHTIWMNRGFIVGIAKS